MITVNIELTDRCNLRCPMCSQSLREAVHGEPETAIDLPTWRAAILGLAGAREPVELCPHWLGEPTLHPRFDRLVEYAFAVNEGNRLFRHFKLHTNAVRFGADRARLLLRLARAPWLAPDTFRFVHFSIDAWSAEVYRRVKGADRRDLVYANVERFLRLRQQAGARHPLATLAFVVQPDNEHEAEAFVEHWRRVLEGLGRELDVHWDWPRREVDTIYLRPLNTADQAAADRLHARVCRRLGLAVPRGRERLRAEGSF